MSNIMEDDKKTLEGMLDIRDEKGRVAITIGLFATFYFEEPWRAGGYPSTKTANRGPSAFMGENSSMPHRRSR